MGLGSYIFLDAFIELSMSLFDVFTPIALALEKLGTVSWNLTAELGLIFLLKVLLKLFSETFLYFGATQLLNVDVIWINNLENHSLRRSLPN